MATGTVNAYFNESGTYYCKMPDGTLICWGIAYSTSAPSGSVSSKSVDFPTSFTSTNTTVTVAPETSLANNVHCTANGLSKTGFTLNVYHNLGSATNLTTRWMAVGRWK